MEQRNIPRIMIAAAGSGSGKTTVTCGLLQAFLNRGEKPASFKCGPDYIDPMFHSQVLGVQSRNLDLFFMDEETVLYLMAKNAAGCDLAILEGVMGYYDGLAGKSTEASSYDLARKTKTPVILLVDCKGMSVSMAAIIKGFLDFRQDHCIRGIILNRISPMLFEDAKGLIEEEMGTEVLGYLPEMKDCRLESRHLGLVTAKEIGNLQQIVNRLAEQIEMTVDLNRIIEIAQEAVPLEDKFSLETEREERTRNAIEIKGESELFELTELSEQPSTASSFRIAVAMDKAFCFYYQDNLDLLNELGAELVPFSPLEDNNLPEGIQGLILGGGYPELYLQQLSNNKTMLADIKRVIGRGIPCIAECGGFMYLHQWIRDENGNRFSMVGAVEGESFPTDKLTRFGYITLTAQEDNLLCKRGEALKAHEFHYWDSTNTGDAFLARKPLRNKSWECILNKNNLFAGYPHVHFYSNKGAAVEFIRKVRGTEKQ